MTADRALLSACLPESMSKSNASRRECPMRVRGPHRTASAGRMLAVALTMCCTASLGAQGRAPTPQWDRPAPEPDRIVLTWSGNPATTQSVTWRTDTTVSSPQAQLALAADGPGFVRDAQTVPAVTERLDTRDVQGGGAVASYHSVEFTGLLSDTLYVYRVGDGTHWSEWFQFRTASTSRKPFSFLYVGDAQNDVLSLWSRVIREGYRQAPDMRFVIHAGDLVNYGNADHEWGQWFRAGSFIHAMVPSVPAAGNHEYPTGRTNAAQRELSVFWRPQFTLPANGAPGLPESSYWFDFEGARILVLDSNRDIESQAEWMRTVLRDNPQPWTIAAFHHPIFSPARNRDNAELRASWKPLFDEFGVDLVLTGHDHTYARGRSGGTWGTAAGIQTKNVPTGATARTGTGTVYVVSVSGPKMYDVGKDAWKTFDARLDRTAENTQLFQVIRIAGDTLRYEARTATGSLYDAFHLVRGARGNRFIDRTPAKVPTRTMSSPPAYKR